MTFSGLHNPVERTPDSSEWDDVRHSRCAEGEGYENSLADDQKLIRRLLNKESRAWREFLERYQRLLYSRVRLTCRELGREPRSEIVEDCCSEILARLLENDLAALKSFRGGSRLSTWLTVVTRRIALRYLVKTFRAQERTQQPENRFDLQTIPEQASTDSAAAGESRKQLMRECLQELSTSDRQVLLLHLQQKMTYEDIATHLGITENAVGPKLSRARKRLKKLIRQKEKLTESSRTLPTRSDDTT